jgi:hypothetical protein
MLCSNIQEPMGTLLEDVARIVRDERNARGFSLAELASSAKVHKERLEALEQGNPGDAEIFAWTFTQGKALFSLSGEVVKARLAQLAIEEVLEGPDNAPAQQGYALARRVRGVLGCQSEPLEDMRALLEDEFGIAVLLSPLATKRLPAVSARSAARQGAAVVLNASDEDRHKNPLLDRVHLAHELCHILFDPKESGVQLVTKTRSERRTAARCDGRSMSCLGSPAA